MQGSVQLRFQNETKEALWQTSRLMTASSEFSRSTSRTPKQRRFSPHTPRPDGQKSPAEQSRLAWGTSRVENRSRQPTAASFVEYEDGKSPYRLSHQGTITGQRLTSSTSHGVCSGTKFLAIVSRSFHSWGPRGLSFNQHHISIAIDAKTRWTLSPTRCQLDLAYEIAPQLRSHEPTVSVQIRSTGQSCQ